MPFIVLEGLDGAGKTTQLRMLQSALSEREKKYEYLHFPRFDAPVFGDLIARFLRGELGQLESVDPYLVALIFAGDRADAVPIMKRWLAEGKFILTDRYVYSNIAFQGAKYDDPAKRRELKKWILDTEYGYYGLPRPDASIFLDVPIEFIEKRLSVIRTGDDREYLRGAADIHEQSIELQRRVREMYIECASCDPSLHIIDCSDGEGGISKPDLIFEKILTQIGYLLK